MSTKSRKSIRLTEGRSYNNYIGYSYINTDITTEKNNMTDTSETPPKNNFRLGIISLFLISAICGSAYMVYSWASNKSAAQLEAVKKYAHDAGLAEAQRDTSNEANAQLLIAMKQLQTMTAKTNSNISKLRVESQNEHTAVDNFDPETVAIEHPEKVEEWANKTTNDLFNDIAASTVKKENK